MPSYDALNYDPPAPIAQVRLRAANGATFDDVLLLLDTGADTTLLPRSAITRLGITPDPALAYDLIGFDGTRSTTQAVDLDMIFLPVEWGCLIDNARLYLLSTHPQTC